jgi:hypothetical protein
MPPPIVLFWEQDITRRITTGNPEPTYAIHIHVHVHIKKRNDKAIKNYREKLRMVVVAVAAECNACPAAATAAMWLLPITDLYTYSQLLSHYDHKQS